MGSTAIYSPGVLPPATSLLLVNGAERRTILIQKFPFTIGRRPESDLVLSDPYVSREHAGIVVDGAEYWLIDLGSRHGTFVNGQKISRHCLRPNDRLDFGGIRGGLCILFAPTVAPAAASQALLTKIGGLTAASDLEKLSLLLEAARTLNGARVLEDVLPTLLELALRLTAAERAYIFLRAQDGQLRLAAGRNARGQTLADDEAISHSIVNEAATSGCEFLLTDTRRSGDVAARNSIIAFDLRTVICIPLCAGRWTERAPAETAAHEGGKIVRGVLYLDSHFASRELTGIGDEVLRALAREAASLVENACLVQAEETARQYQQELGIAAAIQQSLMNIAVPEVPFAAVQARSVPCREIGGDFFDAVRTSEGLALIVADISGKGISASLLAATLQGLIYSQVVAGVPLPQIAAAANLFLCRKQLGAKYATLILALLTPQGELEVVNCGHVLPLLVSPDEGAHFLAGSNLPVGLFEHAKYESARRRLQAGDRLLLYTDGVTEAENFRQEFFGDERLKQAACANAPLEQMFAQVAEFRAGAPFDDDCTILEAQFTGIAA
jgi:serine phosphatase RsbU (regulator of sigma subunit)